LCLDCLDKSCVVCKDFCCYLTPTLHAVDEAELYSGFANNLSAALADAGIHNHAHELCCRMLAAVNNGCALDVLLVWEEPLTF